MEDQASARAFQLTVAETSTLGDGIPWHTYGVKSSLERVSAATTLGDAQLQVSTEQLVVLHSIRRILIWTLILLPLILTAIGIILLVLGQPEPAKTTLYP